MAGSGSCRRSPWLSAPPRATLSAVHRTPPERREAGPGARLSQSISARLAQRARGATRCRRSCSRRCRRWCRCGCSRRAATRLIANVLPLCEIAVTVNVPVADAVTETWPAAGAVRQARRAEGGRRVALRVVLRVREARLDLRDEVAGIRLGRRVLALLLLAEERRESDRGENADDQNDDEKLDEREALIVLARCCAACVILRLDPIDLRQLPCPPRWQPGCARLKESSVALRPALTSGVPLASEGDWHLLYGRVSAAGSRPEPVDAVLGRRPRPTPRARRARRPERLSAARAARSPVAAGVAAAEPGLRARASRPRTFVRTIGSRRARASARDRVVAVVDAVTSTCPARHPSRD